LIVFGASTAHAQMLGKGWMLDAAGSLTSAPGEVVAGRTSVKGSHSGSNSYSEFLFTNPTFIRFAANQNYTITVSYRILAASPRGFEVGFFSAIVGANGPFVRSEAITGATGTSGTATFTFTLLNYPDYQAGFKVMGTGAIAIDDIRITNSAGQLIASENAEGPALLPGLLNFQVTDATTVVAPANAKIRSAAIKDLDGDGYPETVLTLTAPRPSTIPLDPIVIEASGRMRLATREFFPAGAPGVKHSPVTLFPDINRDGLSDILFADAGSDAPPWQGSGIGVALNVGGGRYRDVSPLVPADLQPTRSYSVAARDIDGDGRVEIVLPDQNSGANTALLRWNGNGFDAQRNWIAPTLWAYPTLLKDQNWLTFEDLDNDGRQDLVVGSMSNQPGIRVVFGDPGGFIQNNLVDLPEGLFGHAPFGSAPAQGTDVGPVVVADLNNDGRLDIFATEEQVLTYPPGVFTDPNEPDYQSIRANGGTVYADVGFQVLMNRGARRFEDVTAASTARNLGRRYYYSLIPVDLNNDAFLDIVGLYQTKYYAGIEELWATTLFFNDGTGAFQVVEGSQLLAATTATSDGRRWELGSFVPTVVAPNRIEGIAVEFGGGLMKVLNFFKVVANGGIGTGPDFVDPATLGVPGFNEFYYLRRYPDAAAAVLGGVFRSGLAHYLAVGIARGYQPHAPNSLSNLGPPSNLASTVVGSTVTLTWQPPASGSPLSYVIEAGSSPGNANLAVFDTGSAATTVTVPNVPAGTYYVRVRARSGGSSGTSNEVVVTVGGP
jgi:hypothetical protein